jgi:hypothetical protein
LADSQDYGMIPLGFLAVGKMKKLGDRRYLCDSHWVVQGIADISHLLVAG